MERSRRHLSRARPALERLSEPSAVVAAAASLVLPIPALAAFNKYATQYPLDRLHYALFQLLLVVLVPVLAIASVWAGRELQDSAQPSPPQQQQQQQLQQQQQGSETAATCSSEEHRSMQHKYTAWSAELERQFMQLADGGDDSTEGLWTPLKSLTQPYPVTVEGHIAKPFCFRVVFYAPTGPGTAFDLLSDILRRPEWDELTEATRIIEKLGPVDGIHHIKMKAVWPTAARDSLLLSHLAAVRTRDGGDGFLNVSQSIVDDRVPEDTAAGIVRMEASIAGQLVTQAAPADRHRLGLQGDHWCKVVQIADGDLKGWIPKSVIKFIATQALPRSLTKVCQQLSALPPSAGSLLLATPGAAAATPEPAGRAQQPLQSSSRAVAVARARGRRSAWLGVLARYAAPALIAAATTLLVQLIIRLRRRR